MIGQSIPRQDALEKVTGRAQYAGDLSIGNMCHAKVLRSPFPHARIRAVDTSRAETLPGVIAILTGADTVDLQPYYGSMIKDRPLIAIDKVRYAGEPVAAVAAEDLETAERALDFIEVEYEELPVVLDVDAALKKDGPLVHENRRDRGALIESETLEFPIESTNICTQTEQKNGNVERGFSEADAIFENTFTFPAIYHYAMEPYTCIAQVDEKITVWVSAQHPFVVRSDLSQIFGYALNRVRIVIPYVGGGFGSKSYTKVEPLVVALARKAERPVKLACSVEEAMYTNRRHGAKIWIRTGVKNDGTLTARESKIYLDTGAYADNGPRVAAQAANRILGAYRCPNISITSYSLYTNTTPAGSMRSIGGPQTVWALESQTDLIAEDLGIDPVQLRLKNMLKRGEAWLPGKKPLDADLASSLSKLTASIERDTSGRSDPTTQNRAAGIACGIQDAGASPVSTALVRMHVDGTVTVLVGTTEMGQGAKTILNQIAGTELSLPFQKIQVLGPDTDLTPFDRSTGASRSTTVMGTAVREAALDLAQQVRAAAADLLNVSEEELSLEEGEVRGGGKVASFEAVICHYFGGERAGELIGRGYVGPKLGDQCFATTPLFYEVGMTGALVKVDQETGEIELERLVTVADAGKAINPGLVEGQDEGAAMMGIGHSCFEEMRWEGGQLLNPNLVDYRVPSFQELPAEFETILVENGDGPGPYGAKGVGEGGVIAVAPAIGNAVAKALGVRLFDLPLTPERVWKALKDQPRAQTKAIAASPDHA